MVHHSKLQKITGWFFRVTDDDPAIGEIFSSAPSIWTHVPHPKTIIKASTQFCAAKL
jgi:hypothetical protein